MNLIVLALISNLTSGLLSWIATVELPVERIMPPKSRAVPTKPVGGGKLATGRPGQQV